MTRKMHSGEESKYIKFTVRKNDELLPFIEKSLYGISHNKAKAILAGSGVMVNNNIVTQYNFPLTPGMTVSISRRKPQATMNSRFLRIVYEDHDIIIIDKNPGILSAPAPRKQFNVKEVLDSYLRLSHQKCTSHVVHRLDRDTSGLLVYAKNVETAQSLTQNWKQAAADRRYVALVEGHMKPGQHGAIESWLKDNDDYITVSSPTDNGGKYALTHFRMMESSADYSLVELKLDTGRKNQIRVHMSDIGHPVCGDHKYGDPEADPAKRLCLHAYKLSLVHPRTHELLEFESPVPEIFTRLLQPRPPRSAQPEAQNQDAGQAPRQN